MNLKYLRIFITVYEQGNMTKAAHLLYMTQPAVSRIISELESYYQTNLFERHNHRLYPTTSAHELYQRSKPLLKEFDSLDDCMKKQHNNISLHLGATPTLGVSTLSRVISGFQPEHKNTTMTAHVDSGKNIILGLDHLDYDFVFMEGNVPLENYESLSLPEDAFVVLLPKNHPLAAFDKVSLKQISKYPLMSRNATTDASSYFENLFQTENLPFEPIFTSTSTLAPIEAVKSNLGICILPEDYISGLTLNEYITVRKLSNIKKGRQNHMLWHPDKYLTDVHKDFIAFVRESIS